MKQLNWSNKLILCDIQLVNTMLYITKVYDTDDVEVCDSTTGNIRKMSKKQLLKKLQKTEILGATQLSDDIVDLCQVSIFRFPTVDECEEYIAEWNLDNKMKVYVDESDNYNVYGFLMSDKVYHVKHVVYTIRFDYGKKFPLYVRDDRKYTPYVEEALDLTASEAAKKAAGMTRCSRSGNVWHSRKVYTNDLVRKH